MNQKAFLAAILLGCALGLKSQTVKTSPTFTRADSLRGQLTPLRTCYDINYYHLSVKLDVANKAIIGSNEFRFTAMENFNKLQFDLFENLQIDRVLYKGQNLPFTREFNAVFVTFPREIKKGSQESFTVYYGGKPTIAKNAPWDGGFVYKTDKSGSPWMGVACQGLGASSWWPNKDHPSDEVDSMKISISVPDSLQDISNGRLINKVKDGEGYTRYDWQVSYPINNYDVTFNVGKFTHLSDIYQGENGPLTLDYYVLPENVEKAKTHFEADVKPMLKAFEHWFGPYPFYRDGFKLVESGYLGMEHQSAVAYGNKYLKGYLGRDLSGTGWGMKWDFIIIHEAGHEWFGNHVTASDIAEMWIQEGFTSYSEGLFTAYHYGKDAGAAYINGLRRNIRNDRPVIGIYGVNYEGSGDMYYKGANLLHTLRTIINDDEKWRQILRGIQSNFGMKTSSSNEIEQYISKQAGQDFSKIFDQYLRTAGIPVLHYQLKGQKLSYQWTADVKGFDMPARVQVSEGKSITLHPGTKKKSQKIKGLDPERFKVDDFNFYIQTKKLD